MGQGEKMRGNTYSTHGLKVGGGLVLKVFGVLDLAGSPDALVGRVVDLGSGPLALVVGVLLHGLGPRAAARGVVALGVGNGGGEPVTILLVIPVLGLLSLGIGDGEGLIDEPVLGLGSLVVHDLVGRVLVPVLRLGGLGIGDTGLVDPGIGLGVLGVVDLLGGVDGGGEVLEEGAGLDLLAVLLDGIRVVGVDDESVQLGGLNDASGGRGAEVLLLVLARLGVLVVEDEVNLVGVAALIRAEHDHVGGGVGELVLVEGLGLPEELQVGTTALEAAWKRRRRVRKACLCELAGEAARATARPQAVYANGALQGERVGEDLP